VTLRITDQKLQRNLSLLGVYEELVDEGWYAQVVHDGEVYSEAAGESAHVGQDRTFADPLTGQANRAGRTAGAGVGS